MVQCNQDVPPWQLRRVCRRSILLVCSGCTCRSRSLLGHWPLRKLWYPSSFSIDRKERRRYCRLRINWLTREGSGPTMDVKCATCCCYTFVKYCARHTRHRVRIQWNTLQHRAWRIQYVRHWRLRSSVRDGRSIIRNLSRAADSRSFGTEERIARLWLDQIFSAVLVD
jgi:hypothetical protein